MKIKYPKSIKYPRRSREEKLSCKLTDQQIQDIPTLYKNGLSQRKIASMFGVTQGTIRYWLFSEEERKKIAKDRYENFREYHALYKKEHPCGAAESIKRLRILKGSEFRAYQRGSRKILREKNIEKYRTTQRLWIKKNKEKYNKMIHRRKNILISKKLCIVCTKPLNESSSQLCKICYKKAHQASELWRKKNKEKVNQLNRERFNRLMAKGLCGVCRNILDGKSKRLCKKCSQQQYESKKRYLRNKVK